MKFKLDPLKYGSDGAAYATNEEAFARWSKAYSPPVLAKATFDRYSREISKYIKTWGGALVWELKPAHTRAYLDEISRQCINLRRQMTRPKDGPSSRYRSESVEVQDDLECRYGLDVSACDTCDLKQRKKPTSSLAVGHAIVHFYNLLQRDGMVESNWVRDVVKNFNHETMRSFRFADKRCPTPDEVAKMIGQSRYLNGKFAILLLAKQGLRSKEAALLRVGVGNYDPDERLLRLPVYPNMKRRGNREIYLDLQMAMWMRVYLPWRERVMAENGHSHDFLLVTFKGAPYGENRRWPELTSSIIAPAAARAGLTGEGELAIGAHSLRHFFSTQLAVAGCPDLWWKIFRGDNLGGNQSTYIHMTAEQRREKFLEFCPQVPIDMPVLDFSEELLVRGSFSKPTTNELLVPAMALVDSGSKVGHARAVLMGWVESSFGAWFHRRDVPGEFDLQAMTEALRGLVKQGALLQRGTRLNTQYKLVRSAFKRMVVDVVLDE